MKKQNILDNVVNSILEHPNISAMSASLLGTFYSWMPRIGDVLVSNYNISEEFSSGDWIKLGTQFVLQAAIMKGIISPFTKFKTPKFSNFKKFYILEKKLKQEYKQLIGSGELESTVNELHDCFDENISLHYLTLSEAEIQNGLYEQGIDKILTHLRLANPDRTGIKFIPLRVATNTFTNTFNISRYHIMKSLNLFDDVAERSELYRILAESLSFSSAHGYVGRSIASKIKAQFDALEDNLMYANVMNYLDNPKEENWVPFFEKLNKSTSEQNKTLEDFVDSEADTSNKVVRYKSIFLKEFESNEKLNQELANTKHFSKLNHVVSRVFGAEVNGINYFISPYSGETLISVIEDLDLEQKEKTLFKTIDNLREIHVHGMELDNYLVDSEHYVIRIQNLLGDFLGLIYDDGEFLRTYETEIAQKLANFPGTYYKDNNPRNILYEEGFVREIDFEKNLIKAPTNDLVSTLEFSSYAERSFINEAIKRYYMMSEATSVFDFNEFSSIYQYSRVQRHLELAGYRMRNGQDTIAKVPYHINQAIDALENISRLNQSSELCYLINFLSKNGTSESVHLR